MGGWPNVGGAPPSLCRGSGFGRVGCEGGAARNTLLKYADGKSSLIAPEALGLGEPPNEREPTVTGRLTLPNHYLTLPPYIRTTAIFPARQK